VSVTGPHRDDLGALLDGMEVQAYASRGQARTVALAMKLAEAAYLRDQRRQEPVILLDDVFSELDPSRRAHVLETVSRYEQCIITTADEAAIGDEYLKRMARFTVRSGVVEPVTKASQDSD
jgi:DNA replication and repair protein RecF